MAKKTSSEFLRGKPTSGNREQLFAAINKLFAFLIIFTGLWVSTQYFAYLMGYDPVYVGYPFFIFRKEWFEYGMYPLYIPDGCISSGLPSSSKKVKLHLF